jgi:hypothetical protein
MSTNQMQSKTTQISATHDYENGIFMLKNMPRKDQE